MFEIGFSELVLLGVIALIVIGPERLPEVATTAGHWLGRLQRLWTSTRLELEQKIPEIKVLPELKDLVKPSSLDNGTKPHRPFN